MKVIIKDTRRVWFILHSLAWMLVMIAFITVNALLPVEATANVPFTPPAKIKLEMNALTDKGAIDFSLQDPHTVFILT